MEKKKIFAMIGIVCLVVVIGLILGRKSLMYNYYVFKGDKQIHISKAMDYYEKALKIKYDEDVINKIDDKIVKNKDFEHILYDLQDVLNVKDSNKLYANAYAFRAKENFESNNYETALNYLKKAEEHDYNIKDFEYYNEIKGNYKEDSKTDDKIDNKDKEENKKEDEKEKDKDEDKNKDSEKTGGYIIGDSSSRALNEAELSKYSKSELAYIRNEIFARNGYVFNNPTYANYFSGKSWYNPNPNFGGNEGNLSAVERSNVELIRKVEASK